MGIKRGTFLGLSGVGAWLLERQLSVIGTSLLSLLRSDPLGLTVVAVPQPISWVVAVMLGIVAGDLVTALTGGDVTVGKWAGIAKGLIAAVVGLGALYGFGGYWWFVASIFVSTVVTDLLGL